MSAVVNDEVVEDQISDLTPGDEQQEEGETFPRAYVEQLRDESAKYRQRAQKVDEYAQKLHTARVKALGKLQDPTDLPYDETLLEDDEALSAAVDALLSTKPHLASGRPFGDIGQGAGTGAVSTDLAGMLRARA